MSTPTPQAIRVLIVDDHTVLCEALCMLLESQPGITVVGTATNGTGALDLAAREQPDIILLDLNLGGENALDHLPKLHATARGARVIILTGVDNPELHQQAVRLGAMGLVLKEQASATLFKAVECVHAGEVWLERAMLARVLGQMTRGSQQPDPEATKLPTLTKRERDVLALIGQGRRTREIAARLCISEITVRHHLTSIFNKLGVSDRLELVIYAYKHGLVQLPR
jgi:two-component system nitrate/nitrite response regulator NarL